jgi:regulator of RNase E activity RraB
VEHKVEPEIARQHWLANRLSELPLDEDTISSIVGDLSDLRVGVERLTDWWGTAGEAANTEDLFDQMEDEVRDHLRPHLNSILRTIPKVRRRLQGHRP